jgi:hypothetical protein
MVIVIRVRRSVIVMTARAVAVSTVMTVRVVKTTEAVVRRVAVLAVMIVRVILMKTDHVVKTLAPQLSVAPMK